MSKGSCPHCGKQVDSRGLKSHVAFCPLRIHAKGEEQPAQNIDVESIISEKLDELDIGEMLSQRVDSVVHSLLETEDNGQVENMEEITELIEEVKGLAEKVDGNEGCNPEEIGGLISREIDNRLGPLLDRVERQAKQLGLWIRKRDEQMGVHMNDVKRSVDAQNARVAMYGHKIDGLSARYMAKASPESTPPEPPEKAPAEEEEPEPETSFVGQCSAGGLKTHFIEQSDLEAHPNLRKHRKCPMCGSKIVFYESPRTLKTKVTEGARQDKAKHMRDFIGTCKDENHFFDRQDRDWGQTTCPQCKTPIHWFGSKDEQAKALARVYDSEKSK